METIEEFEVELGSLTTKFLSKFCPLTKERCRADCQSFNPGRVYEKPVFEKEKYGLVAPTCESTLVSGVVYVEQ